uniref:Uncharacterized protein n=1 Tax=Timema bartmani TaxID=61472 RepID=A0A7R9I6Z2_9NEOP|nr:unnamed protein product [Timema bartmani]
MVGDLVDVKETDRGSWVEASILNIYKDPQYLPEETPNNDGRVYCVRRLIVDEIVDCFVSLGEIRPRARIVLQFEDLHVGDTVMVNYNEEDPKARGHWYDLTVQHLDIVKKKKVVSGTLHFTRDSYLNNITITFSDEIMRIEGNKLREEMTEEERELMHTHIDFRPRAPICSKCCDHPRRRCRACSCYLCGGKDDPEKQILCDECDQAYHLGCLDPPLVNLPEMDE